MSKIIDSVSENCNDFAETHVLTTADFNMYLPSFPMLTNDLDTSISLTQLSLTACLLGIASGPIFIGSLSDVFGRRIPLIIALVVHIVSSAICVLAPSIWTLIISRFIQRLAGAGGIV